MATILEQLQTKLDSKEKVVNKQKLAKFINLHETATNASKNLGNGITTENADHYHQFEMNGEGTGKTITTVQAPGKGAAKFGDHIHNIAVNVIETTENHTHQIKTPEYGEMGVGYNEKYQIGDKTFTVSNIGK